MPRWFWRRHSRAWWRWSWCCQPHGQCAAFANSRRNMAALAVCGGDSKWSVVMLVKLKWCTCCRGTSSLTLLGLNTVDKIKVSFPAQSPSKSIFLHLTSFIHLRLWKEVAMLKLEPWPNYVKRLKRSNPLPPSTCKCYQMPWVPASI